MFGAKGCGERVSFLPEGEFCGVIGDDVVFRKELVDLVPTECERGLDTLDTVGETEKVVEDLGYLVCSGCWDALPQKWFVCREAGQHSANTGLGNVCRVLLVQRRGVGEPEEYMKSGFILTEKRDLRDSTQVPQVGTRQREEV